MINSKCPENVELGWAKHWRFREKRKDRLCHSGRHKAENVPTLVSCTIHVQVCSKAQDPTSKAIFEEQVRGTLGRGNTASTRFTLGVKAILEDKAVQVLDSRWSDF